MDQRLGKSIIHGILCIIFERSEFYNFPWAMEPRYHVIAGTYKPIGTFGNKTSCSLCVFSVKINFRENYKEGDGKILKKFLGSRINRFRVSPGKTKYTLSENYEPICYGIQKFVVQKFWLPMQVKVNSDSRANLLLFP